MKTEIRGDEAVVVLTKEEVEVLERAKDLWAAITRRTQVQVQASRCLGGTGTETFVRVVLEGEGMHRRLLTATLAEVLRSVGAPLDLSPKGEAN